MPEKKGRHGGAPTPSGGSKKGKGSIAKSPSHHSLESEVKPEPKEMSLDSQKLTRSEAAILNPNIIAGANGVNVERTKLFEPDDDSSTTETEEDRNEANKLTPESAASNISNLASNSSGVDQAFLGLNVSGYGLEDISVLEKFTNLQKVNLSYNNLTNLEPLNMIHDLVELDVSHNQLTKLLDFNPPKSNLRKVNYAYNKINFIPNLNDYPRIQNLDLSHNKINEIRGLRKCDSIKVLDLSHNQIDVIDEINHLPIHELNLSHNRICAIVKLNRIGRLQKLDLRGNNIFTLAGLTNKPILDTLLMDGNSITSLDEIDHLKSLKCLRTLTLKDNMVTEAVDYRRMVILKLQHLTELDRQPVTIEEKVSAVNLFDPPVEVQASLDHITHTVYRFLQPSGVLESTLPSIQMPYPMLVLCGPQSSGKRELAHRLSIHFPDYFGFGISHTTRPRRPEEANGRDYHFVSMDEFQTLVRSGAFVQTFRKGKHMYGLSLDAIESVAKEGLACVTHMELQGVRTIKATYFEPRYVLILPKTKEEHALRMFRRDIYRKEEIDEVVDSEVKNYVQTDQNHPGFFDMVITVDNLDEAYDRLRQLVMDYLGVSELPAYDDPAEDSRRALRRTHGSGKQLKHGWSRHGRNSSLEQQSQASSRQFSKTDLIKSPVEEASLRRRQEAAIEAIRGSGIDVFSELFRQPIFPVPLTAPAILEGSPFAQANSMYQDPSFAGGAGEKLMCDHSRLDGYDSMELIPPKHLLKRTRGQRLSEMSSNTGSTGDVSFTNLSDSDAAFNVTTTTMSNKFDQSINSSIRLKLACQEVISQPLDLSDLPNQAASDLSGKTPGTPRTPRNTKVEVGVFSTSNAVVGINNRPVLPPIPSQTLR